MIEGKKIHRFTLASMASLLVLVAGCSGAPAKETQTQQTLRVMFWDENYFYQQYGDLFAMKYPDIKIEVVNQQSMYNEEVTDYDKAFNDFIEKEQPDVVLLDTTKFETFISDGKLLELDPLIARDKYNTETIYPGLIDLLKDQGNGKLYGMSPSFNGNVILYNADLFTKYGVELPHDGMTWQEIIDTARRFPTEGDEKTRIYGYGTQGSLNLNNMASYIASTEGLKEINPDSMKITINTDSWKRAYQLALDAVKSDAIYNPKDGGFGGGSMEDYYQSQLFLMGRIAITTGGPYMLQNLKEASDRVKDYKPFELGMVAGPVDPAEPDVTKDVYLNEVFAIQSNSPNSEAAWEFLKFINGEEYAKIKSRSMNNGLMSRTGFTKEYNGHNLDVFYKLRPKPNNNYKGMEKIPNEFYTQYQPIIDRELGLVTDNKKALSDALATIQEEGQVILDKAVKDAEANKGKTPEGATSGEVSPGVTVVE